eukprot:SM000004S15077  [mRNA]  locus=s4:1119153:1122690:+ [translate_table: standard]
MLRRARPAALLSLQLLLPCVAAVLLGVALAAAGIATRHSTRRAADKGPPKDGKPVCILGAGPSGLAAATSLEDKGYNVIVFEKEESVGGRTRSFEYRKEGLFYDEGAIIISTDYVNVLELIDRFNFTVDIGQQGAYAQFFFDPSSGYSVSTSTFSNPFTATQQQNALRQYVEHIGYATSLIDLGDSGRAQVTQPSAYYALLSGTSIVEPPGDGGPIAFSMETGKSLATVYSWNRNTTAISTRNVQTAALATLARLGPTTSLSQLITASFKTSWTTYKNQEMS